MKGIELYYVAQTWHISPRVFRDDSECNNLQLRQVVGTKRARAEQELDEKVMRMKTELEVAKKDLVRRRAQPPLLDILTIEKTKFRKIIFSNYQTKLVEAGAEIVSIRWLSSS